MRARWMIGSILGVVLGACASTRPSVRVLGVSEVEPRQATRALVVFVEVVNPGEREIQLSKLEYRLRAEPWFATHGRVDLARPIAPGSSAIVEIPVAVRTPDALGTAVASASGGVPFRLEGELFTVDDRVERAWTVAAAGAFAREAAAPSARVVVPAE